MSLDGYVSKIGGDMEWIKEYPYSGKNNYDFDIFYRSVSCVVVNEMYCAAPQVLHFYPSDGKPLHVITSNRLPVTFGPSPCSIIEQPLQSSEYIDMVEKLRAGADGDIWLAGDQDIISSFMEYGLVDEIIVNVLPVTLGNGCQLFSCNASEHGWRLINHKIFHNDVVQLQYAAVKRMERVAC